MLHTKGGENMACMNVGARIRYFRRLRGLSQEQLALQAGINTAFLGHLERSLKSPTITTLEKVVKALNISLGELFADEPDTPIPARNVAMERFQLLVRDLSAEQLDKLSDIIQLVLAFPQGACPSEHNQPGSDIDLQSHPATPSIPH